MEDVIVLDWGALTLFLLIIMRMSGFVLISPIFAREGVPRIIQSGFILILSVVMFSLEGGSVAIPNTNIQLVMMFLTEFLLGALLTLVMHIFFMIMTAAGSSIDTQMGFGMAQVYDPASGTQVTVTATYLSTLFLLIFFAANGHHTLLRILLTSSSIVPYGQATFGDDLINHLVVLFSDCIVLSIKLTMPILAAEMLGQVGMGILMKAVSGINVFVINIDLKVLVGLCLLYILMSDITLFLLDIAKEMFVQIQNVLVLMVN